MNISDCVFCAIAAGEAEASIVHQDERAVVFMDIGPITPGHMLVIPRRHASNLAELSGDDGAEVMRAGMVAAASLRASGVRCEGVNLFLADGEAAGQEVFHVHLHVIGRFRGDGFGFQFPPDYGVRTRSELDSVAGRLRDSWGAS